MKTLVIQLARLGDIYQTLPVLSALEHQNPEQEIHFLTRTKFAAAALGSRAIRRHWTLDTRDILMPLIDERPNLDESLGKLGAFVEQLIGEGFDRVINLSFSPFSSHLAAAVSSGVTSATGKPCTVSGYTRFADGSLQIPDDGSAYFYAQVGPGRTNRLHVTDLFAYVAGVELRSDDYVIARASSEVCNGQTVKAAGERAVIVHLGASDPRKTLAWNKWLQIVKGLLENQSQNVVLIGSKEEEELAQRVAGISGVRQPINLVGRTNLQELVEVIRNASLVIGGDSGPMQVASLTGTPCLNLSFPMVSFWETGPRAPKSRIWPLVHESDVAASEVVDEAVAMLEGRSTNKPIVRVLGTSVPYVEMRPQARSFEWELCRALYMSEPFPPPPHETFLRAMGQLREVNDLALEQIRLLKKNPENQTAAAILDRADEIIEHIAGFVPESEPIVRWFQTERLRIGPMGLDKLVAATEAVHQRFGPLLALYAGDTGEEGESGNDDVVLG